MPLNTPAQLLILEIDTRLRSPVIAAAGLSTVLVQLRKYLLDTEAQLTELRRAAAPVPDLVIASEPTRLQMRVMASVLLMAIRKDGSLATYDDEKLLRDLAGLPNG